MPNVVRDVRGLSDAGLQALLDELLLRWLRARNPVDQHRLDLERVDWMRVEWEEVSWLMETVIDEITRRAEAATTEDQVIAIVERVSDPAYRPPRW